MTLARIRCLLFGHDDNFIIDPARMVLTCESCGTPSKGWDVTPSRSLHRRMRFQRRVQRDPACQRRRRAA